MWTVVNARSLDYYQKTLFSEEPLDIYFYFTQKPRVEAQSHWDPPLARASLLEGLK